MLRAMDEYGVDRAVAIPFPLVADFRREHDLSGWAVMDHPYRFTGPACLNPHLSLREFKEEIRQCHEEYGFRALKPSGTIVFVSRMTWTGPHNSDMEACRKHSIPCHKMPAFNDRPFPLVLSWTALLPSRLIL
jgi:hypothetical protein